MDVNIVVILTILPYLVKNNSAFGFLTDSATHFTTQCIT